MTYDYDLLVIGAGPGGLAAAKQAAQYGVKVAIVEQEQIGGLCVNRGCVPKKLMVYAAAFDRLIKDARHYDWRHWFR
jgi:glutathione reductase (NADPH)